ncbi:MAG: hypothetical protein ACRD51_01105, partial [Candidatus Acidiferrum sp.]
MATAEGGPYLQMACFCEKVLNEKDGVLSIIRVIDRLTVNASGPDSPEQMPAGQINEIVPGLVESGGSRLCARYATCA